MKRSGPEVLDTVPEGRSGQEPGDRGPGQDDRLLAMAADCAQPVLSAERDADSLRRYFQGDGRWVSGS